MRKIKVFLIEDNRLLREGIALMLKKQLDMNVVATVGNGENIVEMIKKINPTVVLLDLGLRNQNSLQIVKQTRKHFPKIKLIVMDLIPLQADVFEFVQAGVSGFILKDATISDFLKTIRSVSQGEQILPPHLTGSLFSQIVEQAVNGSIPKKHIEEAIRMTKRERQVILLIADGSSNKEIAQKLHLSPYTVKSHVHNILDKLTLHTRVQIAKYAHTNENYKSVMDATSLIDE
ncbi:MAG: response regulator transcription factor [Melioribacteraceae bacterium]|nr:response regulator transcription factor [Melioribacteraceae bacterium]